MLTHGMFVRCNFLEIIRHQWRWPFAFEVCNSNDNDDNFGKSSSDNVSDSDIKSDKVGSGVISEICKGGEGDTIEEVQVDGGEDGA